MLTGLIWLLIVALVLLAVWWVAGKLGIPSPFKEVLGVILLLVFLVAALRVLGIGVL